jgi:hypothetical protein
VGDELTVAILLAISLLAVGDGLRRHTPSSALLAAAALAALWIFAVGAATFGWRDADGFIDCWPSCTNEHDAWKAILFYTPVIEAGLIVTVLLIGHRSGNVRQRR